MHQPVDRQFYSIKSDNANKSHFRTPSNTEREALVKNVAEGIIGKDKTFCGPFGQRQVVYLDYIASGRALSFIEDYIQKEVLPEYGNTHTTTSVTSLQTTLFRHEARDIIRNAVNASEHDSVIFSGSGTTGAIHKLIHALNLKEPPVVFVGPFEHHSNLLPWKEMSAEVVTTKQTTEGTVDLSCLEQNLKVWAESGRQLIGAFSAASNVTGVMCDVDAVTAMLHRHGALAFWDYATAAPYVRLDMNPVVPGKDSALVYKDAMFFSPHKFVGGINTPGVLIAKKRLFANDVPYECGGGTVFYVRREGHRYLREPELREEGGTPDIVGAIRAGLVLQLKEAITPELILLKETQLYRRAAKAWASIPGLVLLGNNNTELSTEGRLPVFSFLVHHPPSGLFLHHNFVACLLNDLFGIQARGGCACAGPYAMDLLGLTEEKAAVLEELLAEDSRLDRVHLRRYMEYSHREILRPGFTRLNLPYFLSDQQVDFVLQAVAMVAEHGWKLLPQYMFNPETGEWHHRDQQVFKERKWLGHISYASGRMEYSVPRVTPKAPLPQSFEDCLNTARKLFSAADKSRLKLADQSLLFDETARPYRWFLLPSEAAGVLSSGVSSNTHPVPASSLPFCPQSLLQRLSHRNAASLASRVSHHQATSGSSSQAGASPQEEADKTAGRCLEGERVVSSGEEVGSCGMQSSHGQSQKIDSIQPADVPRTGGRGGDVPRTSGDESFPGVQRTEADAGKDAESFPLALQKAMERGYCDNNAADNSSSASSSHQHSLSVTGTPPPLLMPLHDGQIHVLSSSNPVTEATPDCGDCKKPGTTSQQDTADSQATVGKSSAVVSLCQAGGGDGGDYGDKSGNSTVLGSEPDTDTLEREITCYNNTNSRVRDTGPDAQPDKNVASVSSDCSPEQDTDHRLDDKARETVGSNKSHAAAGISEPSVDTSGAGSEVEKKKKKKKKKKKASVDQCVENGACKLQTGERRQDNKGTELGNRWVSPPKDIFTPAVKAIEEFGMVRDGDRVLVCLSGGKDSLSLLHTMHQFQFYCRGKGIRFEVGAVTVDPQTPSYDPSPLKKVLADLGVPYFYESQCIMETAVSLPYECASICSFCSRMKRGRIYAAARREGYNVLALGQHLDDLAESFMMSLFHNGSLRTMKAHYTVQEGDLRVIRPFVYVREKDLRSFAEKNRLPVIAENCPACFEAPKERHRTKQLLASQEVLFPRLYNSLLSAIRPVMAITRTGCSAATILASAGKGGHPHDDDDDGDDGDDLNI